MKDFLGLRSKAQRPVNQERQGLSRGFLSLLAAATFKMTKCGKRPKRKFKMFLTRGERQRQREMGF